MVILLNPMMSLAITEKECLNRQKILHASCESALKESDKRCEAEKSELATDCDQALKEIMNLTVVQKQYLQKQGEFIVIQEDELARRAEVMKMMEDDINAWYRNPYTMVLLGIAAGAVGTAVLGR